MKKQLTRFSFFCFLATLFFASCSKNDDALVTPDAVFSYTSVRNFPVTVNFTNTSSEIGTAGYTYTFSFGDGAQSTLLNPVHVYTTPGSYIVSLQEDSPSGSGTVSNVIDLSASSVSGTSGRPTTTNFIYSVNQAFTVSFTDQSQNADTKHWTFGDGTESTNPGNSFTHIFTGTGPFVVQLTATGSGGSDQSSATLSF